MFVRLREALARVTAFLLCLSLLMLGTGCSTMRPLSSSSPAAVAEKVHFGDVVVVETKSGKRYKFTVKAVTATHIHGEGFSVPFSDVVSVEAEQISAGKTFGAVGLALIAIAAVASIVVIHELSNLGD